MRFLLRALGSAAKEALSLGDNSETSRNEILQPPVIIQIPSDIRIDPDMAAIMPGEKLLSYIGTLRKEKERERAIAQTEQQPASPCVSARRTPSGFFSQATVAARPAERQHLPLLDIEGAVDVPRQVTEQQVSRTCPSPENRESKAVLGGLFTPCVSQERLALLSDRDWEFIESSEDLLPGMIEEEDGCVFVL